MKRISVKFQQQEQTYRSLHAAARSLLLSKGRVFLLFLLFYKVLTNFLFVPALQLIWALTLRFAPIQYLNNKTASRIFASPAIIGCIVVLAVLAAFVWLTAQLGLALGLCLPNLHWVSEAAVVKRSAASMLAMFGGWLLAGGVLFLPLTLLDYAVPPLAAQGACLAALLGLDLLLHRWLCTRGAARFAALH